MTQLPKNIDVNKLRYSELRTLPSGAKTVYVNYGAEKLTIQTPVLSLPYGLGEPYDAKEAAKNGTPIADKDKKYDLTVSFRGIEENAKVKCFHDKLKDLENKIIDDAFANRLAWFKDDFDGNKSFVSKLFTPIVKIDKDPNTGKPVGKYPPTFKAKLPYDNKTSSFSFDSYNMENEELDFQSIMKNLKGAKTQLIVQLTGIWFAGGKYGCSWKIVSGKFQLHQNSKVAFIEDSDTENVTIEDEEDDISVDNDAIKSLSLKNTVVEDDDEEEEVIDEDDEDDEEDADEVDADEDDEEVVPEPEPEPEPVIVKATKKVSKKKSIA